MRKKVAIVILNWNGEMLLKQFLPYVLKYSIGDDIAVYVADNFSTDNSVRFLEENYPQIEVINLNQNFGFAEGYNKALNQIDAEYYVLLNSDVEVSENWLMPIINYLDTHQDIAAVQPKILAQRNKSYFEYAGAAGGFIDKYGYPFCRGRIFNNVEKDLGQYDTIIDILWASGACLIIRSKDYWESGGFDGYFFAHMEEIDLCWRLNNRNRRIICFPFSKVYHVGAATLSTESPRKTYLNFRNNLLMLYKNLPEKRFTKIMLVRTFLDLLAVVQFILNRKYKNAKMVIKAHRDFMKKKKDYKVIRQENLENTTTTAIKSIYPKSILIDYYIKANKIFSKLWMFKTY